MNFNISTDRQNQVLRYTFKLFPTIFTSVLDSEHNFDVPIHLGTLTDIPSMILYNSNVPNVIKRVKSARAKTIRSKSRTERRTMSG